MKLDRLQERLGYRFGERRILLQALTHTSYGHEFNHEAPISLRDNERLEFLGDAVLDLVITDILLEVYPDSAEGRLSKMRAAVVNEKTLARVSSQLGLGECIRLGKGESLTGGREKSSILSSAFEALIAAIYLDGGYLAVYPVVRHQFKKFFVPDQDVSQMYDHKTQLQELVQARWKKTPCYQLIKAVGPDHDKEFEVEVRLQERILAVAKGKSKKEAEQNAARQAILVVTE